MRSHPIEFEWTLEFADDSIEPIECEVSASVLPGYAATRWEPGSGPEVEDLALVHRSAPHRDGSRTTTDLSFLLALNPKLRDRLEEECLIRIEARARDRSDL